MVKEGTTPHNVRNATTITVLCMRARTLRAQYKLSWEVLCGVKPSSFGWHSPEVGNKIAAYEERLRKYIADHVARLESVRNVIDRSASAKERLARTNRSGDLRQRMWEARNEAVVNELLRRDMTKHNDTARAGKACCARSHEPQISSEPRAAPASKVPFIPPSVRSDGTVTLFPAQYAVVNQLIEDEMIMDDLGLTEVTPNEKIIAVKVNSMMRRDFVTARKIQDQIEKRCEHNRRVRSANKARKRIKAKERMERDRLGELNSADEGK